MSTRPSSILARVIALALLFPTVALGQTGEALWSCPGWRAWSGGWGYWWIFPLTMLLVFAACMFFVMSRFMAPHHSRARGTGLALELLDERFARGDITEEEFEKKRTILLRAK